MENNIVKMLKFRQMAGMGLKKGEEKEFVCPLCGGKAKASRDSAKGHLWAECEECGMKIIQ